MFSCKLGDDAELRLIEERHAEELNSLVVQNHAHIREWSSWLRNTHTMEDTRSFIRRNLKQFAENQGFEIAIWHEGRMAGQIGYNYLSWVDRKTELGYWLGAAFQGKGLVTRACRALVAHAFEEFNFNRVEIRCGTENRRSRAVPERLGFKQEGILKQAEWLHDHFIDLVVYRMLASEWRTAPVQPG